jgi:hypothetical protein
MSSTLTNAPTLNQVIRRHLDATIRAMGGALPGTVLAYDENSGTCTVRPGVHRVVPTVEGDFSFEQLPMVYDVPVCWPQGRNFQILGTLSEGDPVLLVCLDRDPSGWLRTGEPSEPDDVRESSWSNAVALPGLVPMSNPFTQQSDAAALASRVDQILAALKQAPSGNGYGAAVKTSLAALETTASEVLKISG